MKKVNKKILTITLFFALCLITMSTVNAAENTTDLGNLISTADPNSTIELEEATYKTNVTNIIINKNITIIGKGADKTIIDADKTGRIFNITSGGTLTLINLTLTNGNDTMFGGAIYNYGKLTVTNCKFTNNLAKYDGGAIYTEVGTIVNIVNSIFDNNGARYSGGAIYTYGNVTIIGSEFYNNYVFATEWGGGAISNYNYLNITQNIFINNSANNEGGAIYHYYFGEIKIADSTFINNTANNGSAIYNNGDNFTIVNSTFNNNTATYYGGAIYNNGDNFTIVNSTFNNNTANNGGAISNWYGGSFTIVNSTFNNNTAINMGSGGAIYNNGDNFTIVNSTFNNNTARYGGAISNNYGANFTIANSTFNNNTATYYGGAILNGDGDNFTIVNSTFNNNTANRSGGAIFNYYDDNFTIVNSTFNNNTANNGGAIDNRNGSNMSVSGCTFINNDNTIHNNGDFVVVVNYNRFLNNTGYDVNNTRNNTNVDFNWWGNNSPDWNKIGVIPNNYFIMNITNITSLNSNGTVTFQYTFKLNNSDSFDAILLPYFVTDVCTNLTNGVITSFDARFDRTFDVAVNTSGEVLYTFATDNEIQTLEGNAVIPIPPEPPIPPTPTPTPEPEDNNKTNNNPTASAIMKETGIPINLILIVLLSVLTVLIGRKQN